MAVLYASVSTSQQSRKTGAQAIADERRRQVAAGYTAEHDQSFVMGGLGDAAANYAYEASNRSGSQPAETPPLMQYPASSLRWQPLASRKDQMALAGAFCAAEYDRLALLEQKEEERKRAAEVARNKPRRFQYRNGTGTFQPAERRWQYVTIDGDCNGFNGGPDMTWCFIDFKWIDSPPN